MRNDEWVWWQSSAEERNAKPHARFDYDIYVERHIKERRRVCVLRNIIAVSRDSAGSQAIDAAKKDDVEEYNSEGKDYVIYGVVVNRVIEV